MGNDGLLKQGRDWQTAPRENGEKPGCHWFEQTGHNICNQTFDVGFKTYWESNGLELDGRPGKTESESLALFGYPISEPAMEMNASGDTVLTQWFERARFEYHPNNLAPYQVQLGLMGTEIHGISQGSAGATKAHYPLDQRTDSRHTGVVITNGHPGTPWRPEFAGKLQDYSDADPDFPGKIILNVFILSDNDEARTMVVDIGQGQSITVQLPEGAIIRLRKHEIQTPIDVRDTFLYDANVYDIQPQDVVQVITNSVEEAQKRQGIITAIGVSAFQ